MEQHDTSKSINSENSSISESIKKFGNKVNKKSKDFMQSCFLIFVYFKCCSDFLLYFYKCSTSMAFT